MIFRHYKTGSAKEVAFLKAKLKDGFVLVQKNINFYTFERVNNHSNLSLSVEFSHQDYSNSDFRNDPAIFSLYCKKLMRGKYYLTYCYIDSGYSENFEILDGTSDIEYAYLNELKNLYFALNIITTVSLLITWFLLISLNFPLSISNLPIYIMFTSWFIYFMMNRSINKQLSGLETENNSTTTFTVVLKRQSINIELLSLTGTWKEVSTDKKSIYYRVTTRLTSDQILDQTAETLNIPKSDIQVIDNLGLFPIGWI